MNYRKGLENMIRFRMCYSGIIQAVWSTRKAKQNQGVFFRIMSNSLRKEILAPFGAGCNATGTVGNQSLPLVLPFSILLHSSEIVSFFCMGVLHALGLD